MSRIVLSSKAAKLMKLCDLEGYKHLHELFKVSMSDSLARRRGGLQVDRKGASSETGAPCLLPCVLA
jgi:hypothetical protein